MRSSQKYLFPEQVFNISRSIEMILGPVIGGIGTLFGPILGAFVLTGLAELVTSAMAAFGVDLPGAKQILVRVHAAEALRALMNHRPELALDLAEALLTGADVDLLGTRTVTALLISGLVRRPEQFAPHLQRALDGPDAVAERAGQAWAVGHLRRTLPAPLPTQIADLSSAARRGAAQVLAGYPVDELPALRELFANGDPGVRAAAASALRALPNLAPEDAAPCCASSSDSPAYAEHFDIPISALAHSTQVLPDATIAACERAIALAGTALGDITTRHPITADYLISVVLRLYRQGDAATRSHCLDVIDQLSESRAYDLDQKLNEVR